MEALDISQSNERVTSPESGMEIVCAVCEIVIVGGSAITEILSGAVLFVASPLLTVYTIVCSPTIFG